MIITPKPICRHPLDFTVTITLTKLVDKCRRKIHWKISIIALYMAEIFNMGGGKEEENEL